MDLAILADETQDRTRQLARFARVAPFDVPARLTNFEFRTLDHLSTSQEPIKQQAGRQGGRQAGKLSNGTSVYFEVEECATSSCRLGVILALTTVSWWPMRMEPLGCQLIMSSATVLSIWKHCADT